MADTKLSKSEIAASAFGGLAITNERTADLRQLGVYADLLGIGPFYLTPPKDGGHSILLLSAGYLTAEAYISILIILLLAAAPSQGRLLIFLDGKVANLVQGK